MSNSRHAGPDVRSVSIGFTAGHRWLKHRSDWGQLAWAVGGMMTVQDGTRLWVVPPHQAVWIPPGTQHTIEAAGRGAMHRVYVQARHCRGHPASCSPMHVTPLLRELLRRVLALGTLDPRSMVERALRNLVLSEASAAPSAPIELPMPSDPRARRAADLMRTRVAEAADARVLTRHAGASLRTLERLFREETALSLGQWRQRAALLQALACLADGGSVTTAGLAANYASTSAFVAAFKRLLGTTPGAYFARG